MIVPTLVMRFSVSSHHHRPDARLVERTNLVGKGDRDALRPLRHHGTSEFALLSQSFLDMARRLNTRSSFISTFATHVSHELKSPLTSIKGAAELLARTSTRLTWTMRTGASFSTTSLPTPTGWERSPAACAISPARKTQSRLVPPSCRSRSRASALGFPLARYPRRRRPRYPDADLRGQRPDHFLQSGRQRRAPRQFIARCCPRRGRATGSKSPSAMTAKASRPTTGPRSSTAFSPHGATAAEPGWASPSCAPCSTPMAARSVSSIPIRDRFELTFPVADAAAT